MLTPAQLDVLEQQAGDRTSVTWTQETALELIGSLRDAWQALDTIRQHADRAVATGLRP